MRRRRCRLSTFGLAEFVLGCGSRGWPAQPARRPVLSERALLRPGTTVDQPGVARDDARESVAADEAVRRLAGSVASGIGKCVFVDASKMNFIQSTPFRGEREGRPSLLVGKREHLQGLWR